MNSIKTDHAKESGLYAKVPLFKARQGKQVLHLLGTTNYTYSIPDQGSSFNHVVRGGTRIHSMIMKNAFSRFISIQNTTQSQIAEKVE